MGENVHVGRGDKFKKFELITDIVLFSFCIVAFRSYFFGAFPNCHMLTINKNLFWSQNFTINMLFESSLSLSLSLFSSDAKVGANPCARKHTHKHNTMYA